MFGAATTMPADYVPLETPSKEFEDSSVQSPGSEAQENDEESPIYAAGLDDKSPINYFFFGFIAILIASCVLVWLGCHRFLRRLLDIEIRELLIKKLVDYC